MRCQVFITIAAIAVIVETFRGGHSPLVDALLVLSAVVVVADLTHMKGTIHEPDRS